jgi:hypothetical protein
VSSGMAREACCWLGCCRTRARRLGRRGAISGS